MIADSMPRTAEAFRGLKFNFRAWLCEELIHWAIKAAPEGYRPSFVEVIVDATMRASEQSAREDS